MTPSERLAIAAAHHIGVRFRLHGRDPVTGLDCIGLLIASLECIGIRCDGPTGYGLRNASIHKWLGYAPRWGLARAHGPIAAGDVLLVAPGPLQHHIMIAENASCAIHAHAGLRRVVRQPLASDQPIEAHWRLQD